MKTCSLCLVLFFVAACAQQPSAIQPVSMAGAYDSVPCVKARQLIAEECSRTDALYAAQRAAVTGHAVGVFLIGVPAASLSGGDMAGEIAANKGKILALEARLHSC